MLTVLVAVFVVPGSARSDSPVMDAYYGTTTGESDFVSLTGLNTSTTSVTQSGVTFTPLPDALKEALTSTSSSGGGGDALTGLIETAGTSGAGPSGAAMVGSVALAVGAFAASYEVTGFLENRLFGWHVPGVLFQDGGGAFGGDTATVTGETMQLVTNTGGSPTEYNCQLFNSASPQFGSGGNISVEAPIRNLNGTQSNGCYIVTFSGTSPQCGSWSQWWYGTASAGDGNCVQAENAAVVAAAAKLVGTGALVQDTFSGLTCQSDADGCHEVVAPPYTIPDIVHGGGTLLPGPLQSTGVQSCTTAASACSSAPVKHYTPPATITKPTATSQMTPCNNISSCITGANCYHDGCLAPFVTNFTMPDCVATLPSACDSELAADGWTGTSTSTEVPFPYSDDLTKPAGSIVTQSPGASTTVDPSADVTYDINSDPLPIEVLEPNIGETYDAYIARLAAAGFVGTIARVDLSDSFADTTLGPSAVAGITIPTYDPGTKIDTGVRPLTPVTWPLAPTPLPRIKPGEAITITVNPPGMPVPNNPGQPWTKETTTTTTQTIGTGTTATTTVSTTTTSGPTNPPPVPGPSASTCPTLNATLDTSPLTGMSFGSKFPFGFFTWISTAIGYFNVTPVAPSITISLNPIINPIITPFGVAPVDVSGTVDLDYFSGYMGTIRLLISFALWIGAVYYIGAMFLGFKAAGDMSGAAEDGSAI